MSLELSYLLWSTVLAFAHVVVQAVAYRLQNGVKDANANRDHEPAPNILTGRATRALRNFQETYPIFVALVVIIVAAGRSDLLTQWGAIIWFWARVVYIPAYLGGLQPGRSAIWTISAIGLILMFVGIVW